MNVIMKNRLYMISVFLCSFLAFSACKQKDIVKPVEKFSDDIYDLKTYKVERHPPVVRNGFGMDFYHRGNSSLDSMYLSSPLPPWHPNNPVAGGAKIKRYLGSNGDSVEFRYDLLFYNEFAYTKNVNGDYTSSGYPVIFMFTHPVYKDSSTMAVMVGQGIACFNAFTADSITPRRISDLKADQVINLALYRSELHTSSVDGSIMLMETIAPFYQSLVIGNKFRPNIGGVFDGDVSDEAQIDLQPVFLIKTREGYYAKFMVTRFKGTGADTQKLTLQWQALKTKRD